MTHTPDMGGGGLAAVPRYVPVTGLGQAPAAPMVPSDAEQEALIAEAQASRDALDASEVRDPTAQQAVEGAYGGNLSRYQALEERRQQLQPFTVARNNPAAKYVRRQAGEQLAGDGMATPGPFEPAPFATPQRMPGEPDAAYMERVQMASDMHDSEQAQAKLEYENAVAQSMAVPAARDVGRDGNPGFIESERRWNEQRTDAEIQAAERITAMEVEAAQTQRAAIQEARDANREIQQQREDSVTAVQRLQDVEKEARAKLEAMPAINGQRYTQQMGWGAKIAALGAAFAGGFSGAGSMADELRKLREEDVNEQRLAHEVGVRNYEAASGAVQQGLQVYDAVMQGLGDRQIADDVYRNLVDEDMIQALREEAAQAELPIVKAQYEQAALEMEQQLRGRRDATAYKAETTPQTIVSTVDPFRAERRRIEKEQDRAADQMDKIELLNVDVAKARDAQTASLAAEQAKGQREREKDIYKETADLADKIAPKQALIQDVRDMKREFADGIPGVGAFRGTEAAMEWASGLAGGEDRARKFRKRVDKFVEDALRVATGAAAPPSEKAQYVDMILEGAGDINGEAKIWQNMDAFVANLESQVDLQTRGRSPDAVEYVTRNKAQGERDAINLGRPSSRQVVRPK